PRVAATISSSPCDPRHPGLHSFPTRRSSDLCFNFRCFRIPHLMPPCSETSQLAERSDSQNRRHDRSTTNTLCFPYPRQCAKGDRSEEHTSELQSRENLVCRLLLEKKQIKNGE